MSRNNWCLEDVISFGKLVPFQGRQSFIFGGCNDELKSFHNLVNFRPRIIWCGYVCHTDLKLSCYLLKYGCNCHWDLKKTGDPHGFFWILRPPQHGVNRASPFPRIVFAWLLSACSFRKFRWWPECLVPLYSKLKRFRWSHLGVFVWFKQPLATMFVFMLVRIGNQGWWSHLLDGFDEIWRLKKPNPYYHPGMIY